SAMLRPSRRARSSRYCISHGGSEICRRCMVVAIPHLPCSDVTILHHRNCAVNPVRYYGSMSILVYVTALRGSDLEGSRQAPIRIARPIHEDALSSRYEQP